MIGLIRVLALACFLLPPNSIAQPMAAPTANALYKKISPSVVTIIVYDRAGEKLASGSGVIVSEDGAILTNKHVVDGGTFFDVKHSTQADGNPHVLPARPARLGEVRDLAMIRIVADFPISPAQISDSLPKIGSTVYAVGSPLGLGGSISEGIVSQIHNEGEVTWIQTTAAISPGSSGGGLFLETGELVGITTMTIQGSQGLNFAIPCNNLDLLETVDSFLPDVSLPDPGQPDLEFGDLTVSLGMSKADIRSNIPDGYRVTAESPNDLLLEKEDETVEGMVFFDNNRVYEARKHIDDDGDSFFTLGRLIVMLASYLDEGSAQITATYDYSVFPTAKGKTIVFDFDKHRAIEIQIWVIHHEESESQIDYRIYEVIKE